MRRLELSEATLPLERADGSVDEVACEGVLKWAPDPAALVSEIHRVLAPGGRALVAEPDYEAAIEHPPGAGIHGLVAGVMRKAGADPALGRRLRELFAPPLWSTELHLKSPDPEPGPTGEALEDLILDAREVLSPSVDAKVLDRWESEVRAASAAGTLLVYLPLFTLVATKRS